MDVELLSKMISELIVDHDMVGLPGVGTFYAEVAPSTFSDKGYTINPPYRRLSFLPNSSENDLMVDFYAKVNNIPAELSREYLGQFLAELASVLKERKIIILPGLGRLRATKENNFFFVPDENLDIYPEAFGLGPVSLKSLPAYDDDKVEIPFEFRPKRAVPTESVVAPGESLPASDQSSVQEETVPAVAEAEPEQAEETPEGPLPVAAVEPEPAAVEPVEPLAEVPESPAEQLPVEEEQHDTVRRFRWWVPLLVVVALAAVALVAFLILAHVAPDFVDSILYTPEELRIINY